VCLLHVQASVSVHTECWQYGILMRVQAKEEDEAFRTRLDPSCSSFAGRRFRSAPLSRELSVPDPKRATRALALASGLFFRSFLPAVLKSTPLSKTKIINLHLHTRDLKPQSSLTKSTKSHFNPCLVAFGPRRPSYKLTTHVLIFESAVSI